MVIYSDTLWETDFWVAYLLSLSLTCHGWRLVSSWSTEPEIFFWLGSPVVGMSNGICWMKYLADFYQPLLRSVNYLQSIKFQQQRWLKRNSIGCDWLLCVISYSHLGFLHFCLTASVETQLTSTSLFSGSSMQMFRHDMVHKDFQRHYT